MAEEGKQEVTTRKDQGATLEESAARRLYVRADNLLWRMTEADGDRKKVLDDEWRVNNVLLQIAFRDQDPKSWSPAQAATWSEEMKSPAEIRIAGPAKREVARRIATITKGYANEANSTTVVCAGFSATVGELKDFGLIIANDFLTNDNSAEADLIRASLP